MAAEPDYKRDEPYNNERIGFGKESQCEASRHYYSMHRAQNFRIDILALVIASIAAVSSAWQGFVARDTEEKQLRAYVSARANHIYAFSDKIPVEIKVALQNHGDTPANDIKVTANIAVLPFPIKEGFSFPTETNTARSVSTLHPDQVIEARPNRVLTTEQIATVVANKDARVYVYGTVFYKTIFDSVSYKQTRFCYSVWGKDLSKISDGDTSKTVEAYFEPCDQDNEAN